MRKNKRRILLRIVPNSAVPPQGGFTLEFRQRNGGADVLGDILTLLMIHAAPSP